MASVYSKYTNTKHDRKLLMHNVKILNGYAYNIVNYAKIRNMSISLEKRFLRVYTSIGSY